MLRVFHFDYLTVHPISVTKGLICFCLASISSLLLSQGNPTIFDCLGAIPICTHQYKEVIFPRGAGNFTGEVNSNFSCLADDNTAVWYTFITDRDGELGFQLKPINEAANFDWGLFDITDANCRDIYYSNLMLVSCNSVSCSGNTGIDNSTASNTQEGNCNLSDPDPTMILTPWNAFLTVKAGDIYALMISNTSDFPEGFEIDFRISEEVQLIDITAPIIKSIQADVGIGCIPNRIIINFSENIKCESISPSNFELKDDRGNSYSVDLDSGSCNLNGDYDRFYVLEILNPLIVDRAYTLEIATTDSQPIEDLCGNTFSNYSYTFDITTNQLNDANLPQDTIICGDSIILDASDPDATSYLWNDSSTNSSLVILESGLYKVTVSNLCDNIEVSVRVTKVDTTDLSISLGNDTILCPDEVLYLDAALMVTNLDYLWNDGLTTSSREITESGVFTIKVKDGCEAQASSQIKVDFLTMELELSSDTVLCEGGFLNLDVSQPSIDQYQWSTGDTTSVLNITNAGRYSVEISNKCETKQGEVFVEEVSCSDCIIYVPNVISKSGDIKNRELKIEASCQLERYGLVIFNRWGNLVHASEDPAINWNGTMLNNEEAGSGIYVYKLDYSYFKDGTLVAEQVQGDILIIN